MATSQSYIHIRPASLWNNFKKSATKNVKSVQDHSNLLLRVQLHKFPSLIGHSTSRINRRYNDDTYSINMLKLPSVEQEILLNRGVGPLPLDPANYRSVLNMSVFDGHGGDRVSKLLAENLHKEVSTGFSDISEFYQLLLDYKDKIGGPYWENVYENRFNFYDKFIKRCNTKQEQVLFGSDNSGSRMIFDSYGNIIDKTALLSEQERLRIYYSFLKFDFLKCCGFEDSTEMPLIDRAKLYPGGSTASSIFVSSYIQEDNLLDESFFVDANGLLKLVVTQVGDSKIILCDSNGIAHSLTKIHSPTSRRESKRLESTTKEDSLLEEDSFGDVRFLNNFANTRSFGDLVGKPEGLTGEPDIYSYLVGSTRRLPYTEKSKLQFGGDECFVVLVTDGVTNILSDQEIVDLITSTVNLRGLKTASPQYVSEEVIKFIMAVAGRHADNATCLVLRLPNWGNWPAIDRSGASRENKLLNSS
ncbi:hypothetical protein Kpol_1028p31 [Vanderwaltozyma polyspora DSM 70294]|uniref:PPM-type phosphatase domain-containing protein n=1 Tax=Vanderwaltozyma polyspora (strain ATCC 22028 / DSM 70294 / BCRC 21397 / CBS 2163 / NBRC 10782 / NRRL Y-8283 / UCD 57-17) TaxID=436907 RepID=A7TG01_VANPO|nr:uncharacterized protein Kpol_1028p31 [Vanderwaltozyma polyspora DSM 70294]EDO18758.1 hypothetical protein Kpol_1028p31 [Vanderwaltozyma polyspora DSM 70294]